MRIWSIVFSEAGESGARYFSETGEYGEGFSSVAGQFGVWLSVRQVAGSFNETGEYWEGFSSEAGELGAWISVRLENSGYGFSKGRIIRAGDFRETGSGLLSEAGKSGAG